MLVNRAGIELVRSLSETSFEDWRRVMSVNLDGVFLGTRRHRNHAQGRVDHEYHLGRRDQRLFETGRLRGEQGQRATALQNRGRHALRLTECLNTLSGCSARRTCAAFAISLSSLLLYPADDARADEGGASFWVPGQFAANLSATPPSPGWSIPITVYSYSGRAPDSASSASGAAIAPGTRSQTWQLTASPTYAPESKILGGQLAVMVSVGVGSNATQLDQTASSGPDSQTVWGLTDVAPAATLGWQRGADSWMVYVTGNVPVGSYNGQRMSNVGIGHAAVDVGGAYTFDSATSGRSVSAALGFTYNFTNPDTNYRSGIDSHLGWSAMLPLSDALRAGLSGYVYYQLTGDSGIGNSCGPCKSRVAGVGPQLNYAFTVDGQQWSANLRGYYEFWAQNRLEGYALFATLTVPIGGMPGNGTASIAHGVRRSVATSSVRGPGLE